MCGICGLATRDRNHPIDAAMLRRMTDVIRHRGPDGEGYLNVLGIGLGIRRLSIIDLETGDQPIFNERKTVVVVCNGEIYNYPELRSELQKRGHIFRTRSDVEVIAHLYEDHGVECLSHLRGMFAFALWDAETKTLFLARDRLGIKPLHYATGDDGTIYFGSELKSILMADRIERSVDPAALRDLFTFGFVRSPKTLFRQIKKVAAGHYILFRHGDVSIRRYWDLSFSHRDGMRMHKSEGEWAQTLREKLAEVVRIHLRSDVPVGAWLSPGIDSSSVVALMKRELLSPVNTYTLTFENRPEFDETTKQKTLDAYPEYGLENRRVICRDEYFDLFTDVLWHLENPTTSGVHLLQYILARESAGNLKVVLTGEGADENLGGYDWYFKDKLLRPLYLLPHPLRHLIASCPFSLRWKQGLKQHLQAPRQMGLERFAALTGFYDKAMFDRIVSGDIRQNGAGIEELEAGFQHPDGFDQWSEFEKLQYVDTKTRLEGLITHGLDRSSMAHSLEVRVPFLDHELVEFCSEIPPSMKMRMHREKYILRRAMQELLPEEILWRKKRGLAAPTQAWLKNGESAFLRGMLSRQKIREKGYFNPDVVGQIWETHQSGHFDYYRPLMAVLGVQVWDDLFVKGCKP
jgi:asparagine synthase (glutamine-hydrolysing)